MDFPKKQAQRLMPLYLLEYSEKLFENHPNPEDPWGGGSDYTAGDGIDITNDVISVDNTIARKSDIPSLTGYATEQWVLDKGYITSTDLLGYATEQWVQNQGYSTFSGSYNDLTNKPDLLPVIDMSEAFTFTETGNHYPPYKWGENMACTSQWVCYGNTEALPQIYLSNWFSAPYEFIAYPQYIWQDQDGYHAVYSTEFTENGFVASGARIVFNTPSLGATWTSVSIYPIYGFDSVHNATITLTQGGVNKGSFTVNQWQDQTIALDAAGSSYTAGAGIDITNNEISIDNTVALKSEIPSTATSNSTSTVTPTTGTFVTGTSTNTTNVVNSVTYTPSSETLTFTYSDNTTASFTFLTSSTTVTSGTTSVVTSVTDSTSNAMTGATVSTTTTTTLS